MEVISTLASISLRTCHVIHGPAIIIDKNSTILVEPDCKAEMTKKGDVTIMIGKGKPKHIGKELDAIQLSIFSHRFCLYIHEDDAANDGSTTINRGKLIANKLTGDN
ncbi:unnamed protein product [Clavelina lepadiformis]|uniref:Uncharacterized protein n=1 Tax=Clavelina lepadiformis TaxID=159417 RepID=A0ABP0G6Z5_CLALP